MCVATSGTSAPFAKEAGLSEWSTQRDLTSSLSEKTLINEARQHHRLMMEESLMKGHLKNLEAAKGQ